VCEWARWSSPIWQALLRAWEHHPRRHTVRKNMLCSWTTSVCTEQTDHLHIPSPQHQGVFQNHPYTDNESTAPLTTTYDVPLSSLYLIYVSVPLFCVCSLAIAIASSLCVFLPLSPAFFVFFSCFGLFVVVLYLVPYLLPPFTDRRRQFFRIRDNP